jgi:hypothetical protein
MKAAPDARKITVWLVRLAWVLLAVVPAPVGAAVADSDRTARVVLTVAAWVLWSIGVIAVAWMSPMSLTAIRTVAPGAVIGLVVSTLARPGLADAAILWPLVSIALAVVAFFGAFLPDYAAAHVQASAYGSERRLPLRVPVPQIAPIVLTWVLATGSVTAFLLALAGEVWWLAAVSGAVAGALTWLASTRLHRFARRWLVIVPAGIVVHDHLLLAETFMVKTHDVTSVRLVDSPGEALDLSGITRGALLVVSLRDAENLALSPYLSRMLGTLDAVHVRGYAVAPTLAGQALAALTRPPATT